MSELRTNAGTPDPGFQSSSKPSDSSVVSEPTNTQNTQNAQPTPTGRRHGDRIVAVSESAQASVDQAASCSRSQSPVLILGPAGSGRKHFARAIHAWSGRSGGKLAVISLGGVTADIQASELFGSPGGAPSSSEYPEGGLVAAARGSLLLAGADRLEPGVRDSLVQALSAGSFQRAGQNGERLPATARIIATAEGDGADILAELAPAVVHLAGLGQRREDILPLAAHFLADFAEDEGLKAVGFTSDARHWLIEEQWRGNVRELRERVRQAIRLTSDGVISAEALMLASEGEEVPSFKEAKRAFETRYVEGLLRRCGGNISRAARLAKKDRKDFYDVIRRTGVDPSEFRN
jgi:two-component system response regulator GlrR